MSTHTKRLQWVLNGLQSRNFDFQTANTYGEPGYTTVHPVIILANWNDLEKSELEAVESVAEIEWSDEWVIDDEGRTFRSSPDSHGWQCSWFLHEGEIVPWDTIKGEGGQLLDTLRDYGFIHDQSDRAKLRAVRGSISDKQLATFATKLRDDLQTGFHPGQNDDPAKILASLPAGEYLFKISDVGQFDVSWEVWNINE